MATGEPREYYERFYQNQVTIAGICFDCGAPAVAVQFQGGYIAPESIACTPCQQKRIATIFNTHPMFKPSGKCPTCGHQSGG